MNNEQPTNADFIQGAKENYPNTDVTIRLTEDEVREYSEAIDSFLGLQRAYHDINYADGQSMVKLQTLFESITAGLDSQ